MPVGVVVFCFFEEVVSDFDLHFCVSRWVLLPNFVAKFR